MKRIVLKVGMLVAAAFALTNCAQKEAYAPVQKEIAESIPFTVIADVDADTKTVNDGNGTNWEAGDQIKLYYTWNYTDVFGNPQIAKGHFPQAFTTEDGDGIFVGKISADDALLSFAGNFGLLDITAVYPYTDQVNEDGTPVIPEVPAQTVQKGYNSTAHLAGANCPLVGNVESAIDIENLSLVTPKIKLKHISSVIRVKVTNASEAPIVIEKVNFAVGTDMRGSTVVENPTELPVGETADVYVVIEACTVNPEEGNLRFWVNNTPQEIVVENPITFKPNAVKTMNFTYDVDFGELYAVADVNVEMEADRIVPSIKTLLDFNYVKQWATNLKDKEEIETILYDALVAMMQHDLDKAYELLEGIPGFEHQFVTIEGSARCIEQVKFHVSDYLESFLEDIKAVNSIEDLLKILEEFESYYKVSGVKDQIVGGLGNVSDLIGQVSELVEKWIPAVSKPVAPEKWYDAEGWAKYAADKIKYEAYQAAVKTLTDTINGLADFSVTDLLRETLENPDGISARILTWIFENKRTDILEYVVGIIDAIEKQTNIDIANKNEAAKQAAILAAKAKALYDAKIAAQQDTENKFIELNQAEVDKLNNSIWGTFRKILDDERVMNLFIDLKLDKVYYTFQAMAEYVENMVQYDEGSYHIVYENCEVLEPKDL